MVVRGELLAGSLTSGYLPSCAARSKAVCRTFPDRIAIRCATASHLLDIKRQL